MDGGYEASVFFLREQPLEESFLFTLVVISRGLLLLLQALLLFLLLLSLLFVELLLHLALGLLSLVLISLSVELDARFGDLHLVHLVGVGEGVVEERGP